MTFLPLLEAKRDGQALSTEQITALLSAYTAGQIPDYQMAAFLMAVFFRGLNTSETRALTLAMRDSGDVLKFPDDPRPLVDKHSTGGVGDKVSLPLAPLLACLGFRVPMISGRGLGITGGTLDKLESIPGFTTALTAEQIVRQVQDVGGVICGQTGRMVPADKALYALRDVTGTVPSIPLITASILSKKLAEGLDALLLDVKFGCAAFMQTREQARALATSMVTLGRECGVPTRALLTDMSTPLGRAAGNWLEVKEAVACLDGQGPADLQELVLECAAHLMVSGGRDTKMDSSKPESATQMADALAAARAQAAACLASGAPRRKWDEMLAAQGADLDAFHRKMKLDSTAPAVGKVRSPRSGYVARCNARIIGEVIRALGGGRLSKETIIHPEVGVDALVKPGETIQAGAVLCRVHAAASGDAEEAVRRLLPAFEIADDPPATRLLVAETL